MIGVFLPAASQSQQGLADFGASPRPLLAASRAGRRVGPAIRAVLNPRPVSHRRDQTPSPCGRRPVAAPLSPASFVLVCDRVKRYGVTIKTGSVAFNQGGCVNSVEQTIEGAGSCLFVHIFLPLPPVAALPPVAIRWANKRLPGAPLAPVPQPSPAAACCKVPPSVRPATSHTASLTPAAADLTAAGRARSAHRLETFSHPRTALSVTGVFAFTQRPRRNRHVH